MSFLKCQKLKSIEIPTSTKFIQVSTLSEDIFTNIMIDAFQSSPITTITFIGTGEMKNQISNQFTILETISLSEGITEIGESVFCELSTLKTLNLPSTIEFISGGAIQKCYNVKPTISKDNSHITYFEDSFYSIPNENNQKTLLSRISRPDKTIIEIPDDTIIIGEKGFFGDEYVEKIIIPESTNSVGKSAFQECHHLSEIEYKGTKDVFINIEANDIFDDPDQLEFKVPNEYEDNTLFGISLNIIRPTPTSYPKDDNSLNGGEIAGIVIASLLVIFVFIFIVYGISKQIKKKDDSSYSNKEEENEEEAIT